MIGRIYYDRRTNRVFQVRSKANKGYLCGGFSEFVSDAKTTKRDMQLSEDYIKRCKQIKNYDKCDFLELDEDINVWRVRDASF